MVWKKFYLKKIYLKKYTLKKPGKPSKNLPKYLQNCIKNCLKRPQKSSKNGPENPPKITKNAIQTIRMPKSLAKNPVCFFHTIS